MDLVKIFSHENFSSMVHYTCNSVQSADNLEVRYSG